MGFVFRSEINLKINFEKLLTNAKASVNIIKFADKNIANEILKKLIFLGYEH